MNLTTSLRQHRSSLSVKALVSRGTEGDEPGVEVQGFGILVES